MGYIERTIRSEHFKNEKPKKRNSDTIIFLKKLQFLKKKML